MLLHLVWGKNYIAEHLKKTAEMDLNISFIALCCRLLFLYTIIIMFNGCGNTGVKKNPVSKNMHSKKIDIQGHRGARGVYPENTIPGFVYALETGVQTLELDVVISADNKIVVSHEPWMSADICVHPDGSAVRKSDEKELNLFKMTYEEITRYDCGSRGHKDFPEQKPLAVHKPLLSAVVDSIESLIRVKSLQPVQYNIETKSTEDGDNLFHPQPAEFAKLLYDEIVKLNIVDRTIVQSFDVRTLQEMRKLNSEIRLALLIGIPGTLSGQLEKLGFTPAVYSPNYRFVSESLVKNAQEKGMQVIPWTINDTATMKTLLAMGVDGIITDYPQRAVKLLEA